jgi:CubicO group peptidase (beta-lactamase class C family)
MDDTFFSIPEDKRSRLAEGIENHKDGKVNTELPLREIEGRGYRVPNGGIYSTPLDLAKFVLSFMGKPSLLKPESLRKMQTIPPGGRNYGLGLMLIHSRLLDMIGHNGSVPGYTSQFEITLHSRGDAVILMRNYNIGITNLEEAAIDLLERL